MQVKYAFGLLLWGLFLCFSCQQQPTKIKKQAHIDSLINTQPQKALHELELLKSQTYSHASEAEKMKLDLCIVKAEDKSYIPKTSDSTTKKLVDYYEKHGSANELMEAYYYHGSAYRDLRDTPKALKYFQKALEVADASEGDFDWYQYAILLEQLAYIYNLQDDNQQAIACAKDILKIGKKYDSDSISSMCLLARYYNCADSLQQAKLHYNQALAAIKKNGINHSNLMALGELLGFYVKRNQQRQAEECYQLMKGYKRDCLPANVLAAIGNYLIAKGEYAEALDYHKAADNAFRDIFEKQISQRVLFELEIKLGDKDKAFYYAQEFIVYSDSVAKAQQLEQARQVNNVYQYYKDALREQTLEKEAEQLQKHIMMVVILSLLVIVVGYWGHRMIVKRRDSQIVKQGETIRDQRAIIDQKEMTIEQLEAQKEEKKLQLLQIESELACKKKMSLSFSEVQSLFVNADGSAKPIQEDTVWNKLFAAVHTAAPEFIAMLSERCPDLSIFDKKMIYLMKIGLKSTQIADILNRSRGTISQHCTKLRETYNMDVKDLCL